jgi:hypothetical protein
MRPRPFSVVDGVALAALALLLVAWLASDNMLQEIEAAVLACLAVLVYIALQLRLWLPRPALDASDQPSGVADTTSE